MNLPITNITILAFGFILSFSATAKTIRIDTISDLKTIKYSEDDTIELNADLELERNGKNLRENAKALVAFLSDKSFNRFIVDSKTDVYYYSLAVNRDLKHFSILERLGPSIRTKVSALLVSHGHN